MVEGKIYSLAYPHTVLSMGCGEFILELVFSLPLLFYFIFEQPPTFGVESVSPFYLSTFVHH
jgi:hypothetical protein